LVELFTVEQVRYVRTLRRGARPVAEWSLDEVTIYAEQRRQMLRIMEVELLDEGVMEDLQQLVRHLVDTWGLVAEPRSKFHLGLALLDESGSKDEANPDRLSPAERAQLGDIAEHAEDEGIQKRVRLILGWDQGIPVRELVAQIGISRSWAYELLQRFREERLSIFPELTASIPDMEPVATTDTFAEVASPPRPGMTITEMCERFQVDMAHARFVADSALTLFDATASIHKLGPERRSLLETMGILHNVGLDTDPNRHHIAGREIILEHPLSELNEIEQRMLAAAVYLHRKRISRKRLSKEVVASLPPSIREDTLALASLLRMADGLDYSQGQFTTVDQIRVTPGAVHVSVSGPFSETDAARAQTKADLWEHLFEMSFFYSAQALVLPERVSGVESQEVGPEVLAKQTELKSPGVLPDDPMGEAGRKVLHFHCLRMLQHESGTRAGEDIEELHDMRVATRRMRAAFRVCGRYFKARAIRSYIAGLRRTARALGTVRDLDVFMAKARGYLETLPPERGNDLGPLFVVWGAQREKARAKMIAYLDSARYQDFAEGFRLFLETGGAGVRKIEGFPPNPTLVRHVAPWLIYTRWAVVQAFESLLEDAPVAVLHALRIECKRLRYTLEFFREVLGPEAKDVIAEVVQLQDHLGNLNDADVANTILSDFLFASPGTATSERVIAPGVVAYLAVKQRELQTLIETFPQTWEKFNRPQVRHWLASAVSVL
jgi:CHAD domain-containing protein